MQKMRPIKVKVVILTQNLIPAFSGTGSSVYLWALIDGLLKNKVEVHLITYNFHAEKWLLSTKCISEVEIEQLLIKSGVIPHIIKILPLQANTGLKNSYIGRAIWPRPEHYYNGYRYSSEINRELGEIKPDLIFAYTVDSISGLQEYENYKKVPFIGLVTDLDHLVRKYRRKYDETKSAKSALRKLRNIVAERKRVEISVTLLKRCDKIICSAYHHTQWLQHKGIKNARYFPVPVLDRPSETWLSKKEKNQECNQVPRILLLGNVNGIASHSGLMYFNDYLINKLDKMYQETKFELRIVGEGTLEPKLRARFLQYSWINITGFVDDIEKELYSCNILLVPTSIPLGFRTRIAEAFSYGVAVVAHKNNAKGMPELINNVNIVLGDNPDQFQLGIKKCLQDNAFLRNIERNARTTYVEKYQGEMVAQQIIDYAFGK